MVRKVDSGWRKEIYRNGVVLALPASLGLDQIEKERNDARLKKRADTLSLEVSADLFGFVRRESIRIRTRNNSDQKKKSDCSGLVDENADWCRWSRKKKRNDRKICATMRKDKEQGELVEGEAPCNSLSTFANDEIGETSEVLQDDESLVNFIGRKKRIKTGEKTVMGNGSSSLDQKVETESVSLCTAEKTEMTRDGDLMEIMESKVMEEDLGVCSSSSKATSNSDKAEETVNDVLVLSLNQTDCVQSVSRCCSENMSEKMETARDVVSVEVPGDKLCEEDSKFVSDSNETTSNGENVGENTDNDILQNVESTGETIEEHGNSVQACSSQVVNEIANVRVERSLPSPTGKKLLVLDVNGLLVDISSYVPYDPDPDEIIQRKAIFKRPYCDDFLKFCFEKFNVGLWSSRTRRNMEPIIDYLLGDAKQNLLFCWISTGDVDTVIAAIDPLLCTTLPGYLKLFWKVWNERHNTHGLTSTKMLQYFSPSYNITFHTWCYIHQAHKDQSHCTNTGFYTVEKRHKPLYLKKLKRLWDKCDPDLPWQRGEYNESNTLLLDDSPYKALCNPRYTAIFPRSYQFRDVGDNSLGPGGDLHVYLKGLAMAENVQEYVKQNPFGQRPITERNLSWGYYKKVIEACSSPPRQSAC